MIGDQNKVTSAGLIMKNSQVIVLFRSVRRQSQLILREGGKSSLFVEADCMRALVIHSLKGGDASTL